MHEGQVDEYSGDGGERAHWTVTVLRHVDSQVNPRDGENVGEQVEQHRLHFRHAVLQVDSETAWKVLWWVRSRQKNLIFNFYVICFFIFKAEIMILKVLKKS